MSNLKHNANIIYRVTNTEVIKDILVFKHYYDTRRLMEHNLENRVAVVNTDFYGNANVFKNFENNLTINI